ncbi:hypothetical protein BO82DRAFT_408107 [Aspergillus uvarum CBS 121591]|uniref:Uncharacterized protein n=1 Tax=Aspergillus uvarum CBS 121591 TaxID=1448315 RepID=A0A319CA06_9EURO|nr:hypothetical protein BO82DRAFT_408107 [Aspergillus uvarum CBS 121591]PYH75313.1 hypothetical protein BO82DRAFT_408107 [Aspergillus uvarum CBS 121591]
MGIGPTKTEIVDLICVIYLALARETLNKLLELTAERCNEVAKNPPLLGGSFLEY